MGTSFINEKGFLMTDHRPPDYAKAVHKVTVKELLRIRRQKRICSQEDNYLEHQHKAAKCQIFSDDLTPFLMGPPAAENFNMMNQSAPENCPINPQQTHHPVLQEQVSPTAEGKITLFHWQIQQEAQQVGDVSPEQLNTQDADGDTFLHIAVAKGRRALAYVLATKMAQCGFLDVKEHNGQTALLIAAACNHHLIVQDLLTHGAQLNTRDLWGRSPLHVCAEKGHFHSLQSMHRTLMGSGQQIDVEMFNYDGFTPLHAAVMSHNAVVKELRTLQSPCLYLTMELVKRRQMYVECIKTLLLMGASFGTKLAVMSATSSSSQDCAGGHKKLQNIVYDHKYKDLKSGRTCLHMASEEANVELFTIFLEQPSSLSVVNIQMFNGNTALHVASSLQNHQTQLEAVKMLMRKGADPGTRNVENELPSQLVPEGPIGEKVRQTLKGSHNRA